MFVRARLLAHMREFFCPHLGEIDVAGDLDDLGGRVECQEEGGLSATIRP